MLRVLNLVVKQPLNLKSKKAHFDLNKLELLRKLIDENPLSAKIFLFMVEYLDITNETVCRVKILMDEFAKSRMTIWRAIKPLKELGYIVIRKEGSCNVYQLNQEIVEVK